MAEEQKTAEQKRLSEELIEKFTQLITSGFGLVAALAWNEAIQAIFDRYFQGGEGIKAKVTYAVLVTILIVLIVYYLSYAANKIKNTLKKKIIKD